MGEFSINLKQTQKAAENEELLVKELAAIEISISSIKKGLSLGRSTSRIKGRLSSIAASVNQERGSMKEMKRGLEAANSLYASTENRLMSNDTKKLSMSKAVSGAIGSAIAPQMAFSFLMANALGIGKDKNNWLTDWVQRKIDNSNNPYWDLLDLQAEDDNEYGKAKINLIKELNRSDLPNDNPWKKYADKLKGINDKGKHPWHKGYWDENGYHDVIDADKDSAEKKEFKDISSLEKMATIASIGTSVSGAVWNIKGKGSNGILSGSYDVSVMEAEANASAYAGLFSYTEDGERRFTPGFGAEAGVGVTAFSASAEGSIGNEYFDLHGNTSVSVGKAEAKGSVNVGLFDANGNLNPQAGVRLSAEALLFEASATGGAKIAGTDIEATGSVNFGVGAHADIGLKDGKLSVDIGASLGVGVSVKLDIDFSGTVNAVADTAKNVWSGIKGLFGK